MTARKAEREKQKRVSDPHAQVEVKGQTGAGEAGREQNTSADSVRRETSRVSERQRPALSGGTPFQSVRHPFW